MDPLSQGIVGAIAPQVYSRRSKIVLVTLFGFLSGMAPDLDVLIRSDTDPLLFLQYHRQFTHSLVFIPIGGFAIAVLMHLLCGKRFKISFKLTWCACSLGFATHGLLDACTSYGTVLFWPFNQDRIAWNVISIIDPMFTVPILFFVFMSVFKKKKLFAYAGILWITGYLSLAIVNRDRAVEIVRKLAIDREHQHQNINVKPSFGNIWVWKTIYEASDIFYVDAVHVGPRALVFHGSAIPKLNIDRDFPWLNVQSQQAKDIERFNWFSMGYIAVDPTNHLVIGDIRYSFMPETISPLWSIKVHKEALSHQHAKYITHRNASYKDLEKLWGMIQTGWN